MPRFQTKATQAEAYFLLKKDLMFATVRSAFDIVVNLSLFIYRQSRADRE
jgi:hypothetical protein